MSALMTLWYIALIAIGAAVFKLYMLGLPTICQ